MRSDWVWDRKITDAQARKTLSNPKSGNFLAMATLANIAHALHRTVEINLN